MNLRSIINIASTSPVKIQACQTLFETMISHESKSGVPEQPIGREEIMLGAKNRLNSVTGVFPVITFESGIILMGEIPYDATYCILRTNVGEFYLWCYHLIQSSKFSAWYGDEKSPRKTFGSSVCSESPSDWYKADGGPFSRQELLTHATKQLVLEWEAFMKSLPRTVLPAPLLDFKGVKFLDLQHPCSHYPKELSEISFRLSNNLLFNKVLVLDARGFLLCGEYMRQKYPIVLVRKSGKLPNKEGSKYHLSEGVWD